MLEIDLDKNTKTFSEIMADWTYLYPWADNKILSWIAEFSLNNELLIIKFTKGYCYFFACMLKAAFKEGDIMFDGYGHFVYVQHSIPYDINGVNLKCEFLIPVEDIGDDLSPYLHRSDSVYFDEYDYGRYHIDKYRTENGRIRR